MTAAQATAVGLLALSLAGCHPALKTRWLSDEQLRRSRTDSFPDARAVSLYRSRRFLIYYAEDEQYTQVEVHEAWEVRNEAGKAVAEVRLPIPGRARLMELRARTLSPGGKVVEVPAEAVAEDKTKDADSASGFSVRTFRFPEVKVGSVLEYAYVMQYPYALHELQEPVTPELPVLRYELELQVPQLLQAGLKAYNTGARFEREKSGDYWRLRLQMQDVEGAVEEPWGPHWTTFRPWWAFRIRQYATFGGWRSREWRTWTQLVSGWAETVREDDKLYDGFEARVPLEGCLDRRCRVERSVRWAHQVTQPRGFAGLGSSRPLREVLQGVTATPWELAVLLRRLLQDAGVEAHLAVTTRALSRVVDPSFPNPDQLNHVLLYLPEQDSVAPTWLDPACPHCAVGQVPDWAMGVDALVLPKDEDAEGEWKRVSGAPTPRRELLHVFDVVLDKAGNATITYDDQHRGDDLAFEAPRVRRWDDEEQRARALRMIRDVAPTAELSELQPRSCDVQQALCAQRVTFTVRGFAAVDGERLLVPLTLFTSDGATALGAERKTDVHLPVNQVEDETIRVKLPEGYRAGPLPAGATTAGPAFSTRVQAEATAEGFTIRRRRERARGIYRRSEWPKLREVLQAHDEVRSLFIGAAPTRG